MQGLNRRTSFANSLSPCVYETVCIIETWFTTDITYETFIQLFFLHQEKTGTQMIWRVNMGSSNSCSSLKDENVSIALTHDKYIVVKILCQFFSLKTSKSTMRLPGKSIFRWSVDNFTNLLQSFIKTYFEREFFKHDNRRCCFCRNNLGVEVLIESL